MEKTKVVIFTTINNSFQEEETDCKPSYVKYSEHPFL